jgi:CO dehydrogenase maturation factor
MCDPHEHEHEHHHDHHGHHHDADPGATEFRVVLTGKGGVGKTSLTALLCRLLARSSYRVLALDADPQMNLPQTLGLSRELVRGLTPLSENIDYVQEKTGARSGSGYGLFLRLNPDVRDVVERFGVVGPDGVRVVVMGTVVQPATGCLCPENSLLASVAGAMSLRNGEAILMDTQAGVEHFGRALAKGFRHALVVTDPTSNGVDVALHAARLAKGLGIPRVHLVVNRVRTVGDFDKVSRLIGEEGGFEFASRHALPYDPRLLECEPLVGPLLEPPPSPFLGAAQALTDTLLAHEMELGPCVS